MTSDNYAEILGRIKGALKGADAILKELASATLDVQYKSHDNPVTVADTAVNDYLLETLPRGDEGWLSEETTDNKERLEKRRVWVVDPLDGTKEFVSGIPEWVVSVGLVEDGQAVAGGIVNPLTGEIFLGARGLGVTYNGKPAKMSSRRGLEGGLVLASRSEVKRGEWELFQGRTYEVKAMGSVAYKLALVSVGLADATWTLVPKSEWDVAAGVALVLASGGTVYSPEGKDISFNNERTKLTGLVAHSTALLDEVTKEINRPSSSSG